MPADDLTDPAPATTFAHLDATTVLSRGKISWLIMLMGFFDRFAIEDDCFKDRFKARISRHDFMLI